MKLWLNNAQQYKTNQNSVENIFSSFHTNSKEFLKFLYTQIFSMV